MAYLVRIQRQRAQSTTRGWQVRRTGTTRGTCRGSSPRADHGGMRRCAAGGSGGDA